jgi:hypothetical protein
MEAISAKLAHDLPRRTCHRYRCNLIWRHVHLQLKKRQKTYLASTGCLHCEYHDKYYHRHESLQLHTAQRMHIIK